MATKKLKVIHFALNTAQHVLVNEKEFDEKTKQVNVTTEGTDKKYRLPLKRSAEIEMNYIAFVMSMNDWATYDFPINRYISVTPLTDVVDNFVETNVSNQSLIKENWNFENIGIGGLLEEFKNIFKRAILPRELSIKDFDACGVKPVKGILLHGPPGTGKTLIARKITDMVNASEVKIVNGPEILSKFVGESEEKIRNLFINAEIEFKKKGRKSGLHIIIFDEIDAICKSRGLSIGSSYAYDGIVNQLLSKFDGVEEFDNFLIIGTTNRIDLIDEALLRAGRFDIIWEVPLPNEKGRKEIFEIHTRKFKENGKIAADVDLISKTKNYTGAEIEALVRIAATYANERLVTIDKSVQLNLHAIENFCLRKEDFERALDTVNPVFGASEKMMKQLQKRNSINLYPPHLVNADMYFEMSKTGLVSMLFVGPPKCGKTASAAELALALNIPFIRICSSENMIAFTEREKCHTIKKDFNDSYKSDFSCVIVSNIDRLIDYNPLRKQFSNSVLQTLLVLLKKPPPENKKLLIICTTSSKELLEEMGVLSIFTRVLDHFTGPEVTPKNFVQAMNLAEDVDVNEIQGYTEFYTIDELVKMLKSIDQKKGYPSFSKEQLIHRSDIMEEIDARRAEKLLPLKCRGIYLGSPLKSFIENASTFTNQIKNSRKSLVTILLEGPPNCGKSTIAAHLAFKSSLPFMRVCSPENFFGRSVVDKCNCIRNDFEESYKSSSCLIIDNIERIIEYNHFGPQFSNEILQTLLVFMKKQPPDDRKLLILCTTSHKSLFEKMDILSTFTEVLHVPNFTTSEHLINFLEHLSVDVANKDIPSNANDNLVITTVQHNESAKNTLRKIVLTLMNGLRCLLNETNDSISGNTKHHTEHNVLDKLNEAAFVEGFTKFLKTYPNAVTTDSNVFSISSKIFTREEQQEFAKLAFARITNLGMKVERAHMFLLTDYLQYLIKISQLILFPSTSEKLLNSKKIVREDFSLEERNKIAKLIEGKRINVGIKKLSDIVDTSLLVCEQHRVETFVTLLKESCFQDDKGQDGSGNGGDHDKCLKNL